MDINFLATVAVIAPDPIASRNLYVEALGLPLQGEGGGYYHSEQIAGCKSFGIWPLSQAARACFGTDSGLQIYQYRRSVSSSMWTAQMRSLQQPKSLNMTASTCCMDRGWSHGARQSLGCSHPRARSSVSPTRRCCTTESALGKARAESAAPREGKGSCNGGPCDRDDCARHPRMMRARCERFQTQV